jgi:hypothetical protein
VQIERHGARAAEIECIGVVINRDTVQASSPVRRYCMEWLPVCIPHAYSVASGGHKDAPVARHRGFGVHEVVAVSEGKNERRGDSALVNGHTNDASATVGRGAAAHPDEAGHLYGGSSRFYIMG